MMKRSGVWAAWRFGVGAAYLVALASLGGEARAGALWAYEDGGPSVGTASAGQAAMALDASTVRGNPAGMTRLEGNQILVGIQPLILDARFDRDRDSPFGGGNGGQAGAVFPSGGLYYSHSITEDFKAGLLFGSYLGLGVDYDNDWAGRYYSQEATLGTISIIPAAAYRFTPWLSLGGGVGMQYATLDQRAAINNQPTDGAGFPDGQLRLDDDSWAPVGYVGVLLEPSADTRFGVTYFSEADHEFNDAVELRGVGPNLQQSLGRLNGASADLDITIPQSLMVSAFHQLTPKLALMGNVTWQDWSRFGETNVTVDSANTTSFTQDRNFNDTWQLALGAMYRIDQNWLVSSGIAYDTSPVKNKDRTPDLPVDRQIRLSAGVQYFFTETNKIGLAYTYMDAGDADIRQSGPVRGTVEGNYSSNSLHAIALYTNWKF